MKNDLTHEKVFQELKDEFSNKYSVKIITNPFFRNLKSTQIEKNSYVGVKIFLRDGRIYTSQYVPSTIVRVLFGFLIFLIYQDARDKLEREILEFLNK